MAGSINFNLNDLNQGAGIFTECENLNRNIRTNANSFYGALINSKICDRNLVYSSIYLNVSDDLKKVREDLNHLEELYSDVLAILNTGVNELNNQQVIELETSFKNYFSDIDGLVFKDLTPEPVKVETPTPAPAQPEYRSEPEHYTPSYVENPTPYVAPVATTVIVEEGSRDNTVIPDNTPEYNEVVTNNNNGEKDFVGGTYKGVKLQYSKRYNVSTNPLTSRLGVVYFEGHKETYYSQRVLPGGGLKIPGRHVAEDGTVRDKDGFICIAANHLKKGAMIMTSLGPGKVYDCGDMVGNWIDIYVDW